MVAIRVAGLLASIAIFAACGAAPPPEAAAPASANAPASPSAAASAEPAPASAPDVSPPPAAAAPAPDPGASGGGAQGSATAGAPRGATASTAGVDKNPLTGKISQKTIMDLVMKNQELFNDCYTIGAGGSKQFVATVTVKASVGPTGVVNATQVVKSTAKNAKVDKCVSDAFKKIAFPATGSTVPITFPMEFNGAEQISK